MNIFILISLFVRRLNNIIKNKMKQKKQPLKKLSLRKIQLTKINNLNSIRGGSNDLNFFNEDGEPTGTGKTR